MSGWEFDKKISIGHLLTTLTIAVGAFIWASRMEKRIEINSVKLDVNTSRISAVENQIVRDMHNMKLDNDRRFDIVIQSLRDIRKELGEIKRDARK